MRIANGSKLPRGRRRLQKLVTSGSPYAVSRRIRRYWSPFMVTAYLSGNERWFRHAATLSTRYPVLTPELVGKLATASGLDKTLAHEGVAVAVPAILSGLAGVAGKPDGARQLASAIAKQSPDLLAISPERARRPPPRLAQRGAACCKPAEAVRSLS